MRGPALGRVRADRGPRADRRRRGARRLLQARGRPALRRPRRRRPSARGAAARCCCSAAPRRARRAFTAAPSAVLPSRVDGRPLPAVEVLDMRGQPHGLHPLTAQALAEVRAARGGKAIVLLNRRGWSNFLSCRSCGRVWGCPHCDVALVLHRAGGLRGLPPLRPPRARCRAAAATAARRRSPATAPAPSACSTSWRASLDDGELPGLPPRRRRGRGPGARRAAAVAAARPAARFEAASAGC